MAESQGGAGEEPRLYLKQILVGPMANYVYVIGDRETRKAVIVDPAWNIDGLMDEVEKDGFELEGALVTHYHPDHIGGDFMGQHIEGIRELLDRKGMKIYIHKEEAPWVRRGTGLESSDVVAVDGETEITVGDIPIRYLHTPGHTPASQCFLVGGNLVSGDTLFIGACGRVDLPGSNPTDLYYSLTQKLAKLPDDTLLFPGHDYAADKTSTIGREKRSNPYMRFPRLEDYLRAMGYPS
jgi:hydroxyacylglutathione hydrolase